MAPKLIVLPEDVPGGGRGLILNYFKRPPAPQPPARGPGRPPKDSATRGRPPLPVPHFPQVAEAASPALRRDEAPASVTPGFVTPAASATNVGVVKKEHQKVNWAADDALKHLTLQVGNWLSKVGPIIERNRNIVLKQFCALVDIPHETFRKYVCSDVGKRRVLGKASGLPRLGSLLTEMFVVDVLIRQAAMPQQTGVFQHHHSICS